jgi:hypothetical protein
MIRKTILATAATLAIGAATFAPTAALAKGPGGPGFHGHHGHYWGGFRFGVYSDYASCWQYQWVKTRAGMQWLPVNVCAYPY